MKMAERSAVEPATSSYLILSIFNKTISVTLFLRNLQGYKLEYLPRIFINQLMNFMQWK